MNIFLGTIDGKFARLGEEEALHSVKVLRNRIGDKLIVTDGNGHSVEGSIIDITKKEVLIEVEKEVALPSISTPLHIAIAPTKNLDRFEFFIEKAIELGVSEITPLITFHSERRKLNEEKLKKRALNANTQSLRSHFAIIHPLTNFQDFIQSHSNVAMYITHCDTNFPREPLTSLKTTEPSIVLIGPEGDFSVEEIQTFTQNHKAISLGPNRLRTETAGIAVADYFYSNFI